MTRRLIVDVDNVVWDAYPWTLDAVNKIFHTHITLEDVGHWYGWEGILGPRWFDAFEEALHPERVKDRVPLPNSQHVLYFLSQYFWIHFVSHNPKPKALYEPLRAWINDNYLIGTGDPGDNPGFDLTIFGARNCKVDYMDELGDCWGIIEDKPSTLRKASNKGYVAFGRVTPLNDHEDIPRVNWFHDWDELYIIPEVLKEDVLA